MTRKSAAEIEETAKKILDDFAQSLARLDGGEFALYTESVEKMRVPKNPPEKGFKERMMKNFPREKDGEPLMEKRGW